MVAVLFPNTDPPSVAPSRFSPEPSPPALLSAALVTLDFPNVPFRMELILDSVPEGIIPSVACTNTWGFCFEVVRMFKLLLLQIQRCGYPFIHALGLLGLLEEKK